MRIGRGKGDKTREPMLCEVELICLPAHPEVQKIYFAPEDMIYVNTAADNTANITRTIHTLLEFIDFAGGLWTR